MDLSKQAGTMKYMHSEWRRRLEHWLETLKKDLYLPLGGIPVEGLYCAGDTIGNRYINQGGEKLECINDFSWAFASGYLAGKKILEYLG